MLKLEKEYLYNKIYNLSNIYLLKYYRNGSILVKSFRFKGDVVIERTCSLALNVTSS